MIDIDSTICEVNRPAFDGGLDSTIAARRSQQFVRAILSHFDRIAQANFLVSREEQGNKAAGRLGTPRPKTKEPLVRGSCPLTRGSQRADDEIRIRDPHLGKVVVAVRTVRLMRCSAP